MVVPPGEVTIFLSSAVVKLVSFIKLTVPKIISTTSSSENIRKNYKYDINIFQANSKGSEIIWDCKVKLLSVKPQQLKNIIELEKNKPELIYNMGFVEIIYIISQI